MATRAFLSAGLVLLLTPHFIACSDAETVTEPVDDSTNRDDRGDSDDADESGDLVATTEQTLSFDGVERTYLLTVPQSYSGEVSVPLLLNLHALQGSAEGQLATSEFEPLAEREGFLLVTPQAVGGVWTVTGFPMDNGADDLGFITALVDELSSSWSVDADRIYATGMSQGGFLSFDLVCGAGPALAAIAPVAGVMTPNMAATCAPARRTPVLQTHGTADSLVDYEASQAVVQWWVTFNGASGTPEVSSLPDTFPQNGTTVDQFVHSGGSSGVDVMHLRINGGGHAWPGSEGDSDVDIAEAIWSFLSRYDLDGRIEE